MIMVMGATGHVGGAVARALLARAEEVGAIVRDPGKAKPLEEAGATLVRADIDDPAALAAALGKGKRAF